MSRYFCVRFSSDQTARIASVVKMPWKMLESMMLAAMGVLLLVRPGPADAQL